MARTPLLLAAVALLAGCAPPGLTVPEVAGTKLFTTADWDRRELRLDDATTGEHLYQLDLMPSDPPRPRTLCASDAVAVIHIHGDLPPAATAWRDHICDQVATDRGLWPPSLQGPAGWAAFASTKASKHAVLPLPPRAWGFEQPVAKALRLRPLHAVVVAWWLLLALALPRSRSPWLAAGAGLAVRLMAGTEHIFMGSHYPYSRSVQASGLIDPNILYGDTWNSFMGLGWWASGGVPPFLHGLNLLLSTLTVPLVWLAALRWDDDHHTADVAAWAVALLPLAAWFAGTESMFVLATTLQVAAAVGVLGRGRVDGLLAVASLGLLAHLRPYQLGVVGLAVVILAVQRRWLVAGAAAALAAWRGAEILALVSTNPDVLGTGGVRGVAAHLPPMLGRGGTLAATDPFVVPAVLLPLAAWACWRLRRQALPVVLATGLTVVPYLPFGRVTDVLRFALPSTTWLVLLAAAGWARLTPKARMPASVFVAATWALAARPWGPMPWRVEHAAMLALPAEPTAQALYYDRARDPYGTFRSWTHLRFAEGWTPLEGPAPPGALVWRSRFDAATPGCADGQPVSTLTLPTPDNEIETYPAPSTTIGLYRCPGSAPTSEPEQAE